MHAYICLIKRSASDSYPVDYVRCILGDEKLGGFDGVDDRQDFVLRRINEILRL